MPQNKRIIVPTLALIAALSAVACNNINQASADENTPTSIIQKIATKFNLSEDDVKKVFDDDRTEQEAKRKEAFEAKLSEAVSSGELTEEKSS